jgi:hypothetical protein
MAVIALTLAPALTVALTLALASEGALVTLTDPPAGAAPHTLTLAAAGPMVIAAVGELMRGPAGEPGAAGPAGSPGDCHATHLQPLAADTWQVVHNLDKRPSVTVVDSAGDTVEGDVTYLDSNRLSIHFSAAFSGSAFLN